MSPDSAAHDDDITIERRARVTERAPSEEVFSTRKTTRMSRVDARLLALARGEIGHENDVLVVDDPFGGLIPVYDEEPALEVEEAWLVPEPPLAPGVILRRCMRLEDLVALPLDHRSGFLLSHIDGRRTLEEIIDVSHLGPADTLGVIEELIALHAIEIV